MQIKELRVDGYGSLRDVGLVFGPDGPTGPRLFVLYGPNEAGKSTLLRFLRSMLYGFPTRKEPVERGEPVYGGRHGGRLVAVDRTGTEWLVERYAERSGELRIRDVGGRERTIAQPEWERLMLGGLSEKLFRQLFAVSLNELHELRTLQGEELGNYLYHAGMAGGQALREARRKLGSELDRLYRPKGSTQEINRVLARIKEVEAEIRRGGDAVRVYLDAEESAKEIEDRLSAIEAELPNLRRNAAKLEAARDLREWWLRREALLAEDASLRAPLPVPEAPLLPVETRADWNERKAGREKAADKLRERLAELDSLRRERERLVWDDELLAALPELDRLEHGSQGIAAKLEERSVLEAERRASDDEAAAAIAAISPDWGEAELAAFAGVASEREFVRKLQAAWEEAEQAERTLRSELRRLDRQKEALLAERAPEAAESPEREAGGADAASAPSGARSSFVPRTKAELRQAWNEAEDARREYERTAAGIGKPASAVARSESRKRGGSGRSPMFAAAAAAALAALAVALFAAFAREERLAVAGYVLSALLAATAAGAAAFAIGSGGGKSRGRAAAGARSDEAEAGLRSARAKANDRLGRLFADAEIAAAGLWPDSPDERSGAAEAEADALWAKLRDAVQAELERLEAAEREAIKSNERLGRMRELRQETDLLVRDAEEQARRLEEIRTGWRNWLEDRRLPARLSPRSMPDLFAAADRGREALRRRKRVEERLVELDQAVGKFDRAAAEMAGKWHAYATRGDDPESAVRALYREASAHKARKEAAEAVDLRIEAAEASVSEAKEELDRLELRIAGWLRTADASDEAEFEARLAIDETCRALRREALEIRIRLESGRDERARDELYALLSASDEASLAAEVETARAALAFRENERSELLDKRGRLAQELERLRAEAEREDKRQVLSELQARLEQLAERYAVAAIAGKLIERTKTAYEEEKQPEVLLRASGYFRRMTGGAYVRIVAPGDSKALLAETPDRRWVDCLHLSRGTQEQMYLAMRFALCEAASPEYPLPLLLDDLFVHFDESRLAATLPVLAELSERRQVILFTCHRHAAKTISEGIPGSGWITLGDEGASTISKGDGNGPG